MGTIVYSNLISLILEEGSKTKEEIIQTAIEKFGFQNIDKLSSEIGVLLEIGNYKQDESGKYSYNSKIDESPITGRRAFLKLLQNVPQDYFKERPYARKLKEVLESRLK